VDEGKASVAHVPLPSTKYATGCAKTLRMERTDRTQTSQQRCCLDLVPLTHQGQKSIDCPNILPAA